MVKHSITRFSFYLFFICFSFFNLAYAELDDFINPGSSLSLADFQFIGEDVIDHAGYAVASAGDVDGDGIDDFLISAILDDEGGFYSGAVYVIFSASLDPLSPVVDLSNADVKLTGESNYDHAGSAISAAGDVDGDGLGDLILGSYAVDSLPLGLKGTGTEECPLETITEGIYKAVSFGLTRVVVQGWFYDEIVTLETGIELVGNIRTSFFFDVPPLIYYSGAAPDYLVTGANEASMENFVIDGAVQLDGVNNMIFRKNYIYHPEQLQCDFKYLQPANEAGV